MTMVGGKVVHGEEDFVDLAPPLPPASPSWTPAGTFANPGMRYASMAPSVQHARNCHDGSASACGIHGHDHRIAWPHPNPARALHSLRGPLRSPSSPPSSTYQLDFPCYPTPITL